VHVQSPSKYWAIFACGRAAVEGRAPLPIFAGGYFYVGFGTLLAMWEMSQEEEEEVIDVPELTA